MATRDILVLNTTASRAETQQGSDTVVIRGNSGEALSVENSSGTSILSVNTISSSTSITGDITASGDVKITGTGSIGRIEATTLVGDAFNLTNTAITNTISASSQIANQISGSFRTGFEFDGKISGSAQSTGSFGRIVATTLVGDASELTNTDIENTLTSSAQIADRISGSFNKGFEFSGTISGSATSTGSFAKVVTTKIVGDASQLTNTIITDTVSGSAQIASYVSGSFNKGFEFDGIINNIPLSFAAGGAMINMGAPAALYVYHRGGAGNKNAGLFFGGFKTAGVTTTATTEEYNGTSFSEVNDMNNAGSGGGAGTSEAALMTGGYGRACDTEEYNGTNWSQVNDMNIDYSCPPITFGATSEAVVAASGEDSPYTQTETWNGTNWSTANQMINDARFWIGGTGTSNAGITVGGVCSPSPQNTKTELWNGTNWSAGPNTTIDNMKLTALVGSQNDALTGGHLQRSTFDANLFSNYPNASGRCSIRYDGSSWSAAGDLGMGCSDMNMMALTGIGQSVGVGMFGGGLSPHSPHYHNCTFEVNDASVTTGSFGRVEATTIVGSAANLTNTTLTGTISSSAQIASRISGSFTSGFEFTSGNISGSATSTGSFSKIKAKILSGDVSKLTNTIPTDTVTGSAQIASYISGSFNKGFEFDGKIQTALGSWSAGGELNTARTQDGGVGTKAAFIQVDSTGKTEIYNGSSWSEVNDMISGKVQQEAAGSSTSALVFGGWTGTWSALSEEWNGTNWSAQVNMPISRSNHSAAGQTTADSALAFGGGYPPAGAGDGDTMEWNGSSWTTYSDTDLAPGHRNGVGFGSTEAALYNNTTFPQPMNKEWNGSAWSDIATSLQGHDKGSGGGTVNDGVVFGGGPSLATQTELYDGTSWSQQGSLSIARIYTDGGGTAAANVLAVGGQPGRTSVEHFSTFVSTGSFGRVEATTFSGTGTNLSNITSGLLSGSGQIADRISGSFNKGFEVIGNISGSVTSTGSFTFATAISYVGDISKLDNTAVAGTISSSAQIASQISGSFNKGFEFSGDIKPTLGVASVGPDFASGARRHGIGRASSQNNALTAGGYMFESDGTANSWCTCTETWNGITWTEQNNLINGQSANGQYFGDASSGHLAGGSPYQSTGSADWNGTNWSVGAAFINAVGRFGGFGLSGTGLIAGGSNPAKVSELYYNGRTEIYPGTAYEVGPGQVFNTFDQGSGTGTLDSGISAGGVGGNFDQTPFYMSSQEWDGSSWSAAACINERKCYVAMSGTTNDATMYGGAYPSPYNAITGYQVERYDGVSWTMASNALIIHRARHNSGGGSAAGINFGGTFASPMGTPTSLAKGPDTEFWDEMHVTASIGRFDADVITGDISNLTVSASNYSIQSVLHASAISSSDQIKDRISGSAAGGFTTTGDIKPILGSWSQGGGMNVFRRFAQVSKQGTIDAGWIVGGLTANGISTQIEHMDLWNGSSWTVGADMITGRAMGGGAGTSDAGLVFGGYDTPAAVTATEEYNGTSWATATAMGTATSNLSGGGTQNAAVLAGGYSTQDTCHYDGLNWSLNAKTLWVHGTNDSYVGTQNSGFQIGGYQAPDSRKGTMKYNGMVWSQAESLNVSRWAQAGFGSQNSAVAAGGDAPSAVTCTEKYDGTSFSIATSMNIARACANGFGGGNNGLAAGGDGGPSYNPYRSSHHTEIYYENPITGSFGRIETPNVSITGETALEVEESLQLPLWGGNPPVTSSAGEVWYNTAEEKLYFTYDINTWSEVTDMNTDKSNSGAAACSHGDAIIAGGRSTATPNLAITEVWDGNTWSEVNDLNQARRHLVGAGYGSTSALVTGGFHASISNDTEEWNGTNWTEVANNTYAYAEMQMSGTSNAAMSNGGVTNSPYAEQTGTAEWNGTSWTAAAARSVAVAAHGGAGSQNSAITFGGEEPGTNELTCTEEYNGTNWATGIPLLIAANSNQGSGTQNAAMSTSTQTSPYNQTQEYNGSAWSQTANLTAGLKDRDGGGSQSSTIVMGGNYGVGASKTEQYTTTGIGCHCIGGV